ncbi:MAG: hypothetical protein R3B06_09915 [Kofleriaceae bacterium]
MRVVLVGIAAALASAASASAAPALIGMSIDGAPSPEVEAALRDAAVSVTGRSSTPPDTCVTAACTAAALTNRGGERGVTVAVTVSGSFHDQFALALAVVDDHGRVLRRRRTTCETCSVAEAVDALRTGLTEMLAADGDDRVTVQISTTPVPAEVRIDGGPPAASPWSGPLVAGPHTVAAGAVTRDVFVEAVDQPAPIVIDLPTVRPQRRFGVIPYGVGAGGVAMVGLGAYLVAIDGDPTCAHPTCPEVRSTATGGWLSVTVGVLAIGAAGTMYWLDHRQRGPVLAVTPTGDGVAAFAAGRF